MPGVWFDSGPVRQAQCRLAANGLGRSQAARSLGTNWLRRRIMAFPLRRDEDRWAWLQEALALYRLAFGQPRQEDMVAVLRRRGVAGDPERIADMRIDLRPPVRDEVR